MGLGLLPRVLPWTLRYPIRTLRLAGYRDAMFRRPLNLSNRRVQTRTHGGVGGVKPRGVPLSRLCVQWHCGRIKMI